MIPLYIKSNEIEVESAKRVMPENRAFNWYCSLITDIKVIAEVKIFNAEGLILDKCKKLLDKIYSMNSKAYTIKGRIGGLILVIGHMVIILVSIMVAVLNYGKLEISDLVCVFGALSTMGIVGSDIISDVFKINKQLTMLNPFFQIVEDHRDDDDMDDIRLVDDCYNNIGVIEFRNVTFSYPESGKCILKNVSFKIYKGQKVGIVGLNGAGKTTLIKLLCRLYEPDKGAILFNDKDISKIPLKEYRKMIAVMFQDFELFPIKLIENIECMPYNENRNYDWIINEPAYKWINVLPYKEKTYISPLLSDKCTDLSGGQKQTIAFMRAKFKYKEILILDEPT